jgi:hypothetical protein
MQHFFSMQLQGLFTVRVFQGGISKKLPYYTEVVGDKKFGVLSHVMVEGVKASGVTLFQGAPGSKFSKAPPPRSAKVTS